MSIKINSKCRRNSLNRFYTRIIFLAISLMAFWLMLHISSFYTFNEQRRGDVREENVNLTMQGHDTSKNITLSSFQQASSLQKIQRRIEEYNKIQAVLNENNFGPLRNNSLVIVVQVHNRLMYLKYLIFSLSRVKGIKNALLIFSHDYYDEKINNAVRSIDFCKVMQIFYPYSIQTHPNDFPGQSKDDCPLNISMEEAIKRKCINALHPDRYGHYREAKFTQTKHHWWWKANRVFDGLNITKNYTGLVVFFEEDHYVAQDFIHMLHLMDHTMRSNCPNCNVFSLGKHEENVNFAANAKKAEVMNWSNGMHNMGMTFNRSTWKEFKSCAKIFCTYDDYNWDWTLLAVSNKCLSKEVTTMVLSANRVFHIGECGMHFNNSCNNKKMMRKAQKLLVTSRAYLYPEELHLTYVDQPLEYLKNANANGGWGDVRDHNLCMKMMEQSSDLDSLVKIY